MHTEYCYDKKSMACRAVKSILIFASGAAIATVLMRPKIKERIARHMREMREKMAQKYGHGQKISEEKYNGIAAQIKSKFAAVQNMASDDLKNLVREIESRLDESFQENKNKPAGEV